MRKNYPLRRWKSEQQKALLYIELDELILVVRPNFEKVLVGQHPISYSESHFKMGFKSSNDAKTFAKKMKSPFEIEAEVQGFVGDLEIIYN